ncbi:MAG: hypothetical protein U9R44_06685 [Candidatus Omnitrophota bacterium]|nr:hypothetical protein [Candidatus Omnitrophota bacterium]
MYGLFKTHITLRKLLSSVSLFALIACFVFVDAWAALDTGRPPFEILPAKDVLYAHLDIDTFTIPAHLGDIKYRYKGDSKKFIVHIQDAHCNFKAQNKISSIIDYVNKEYGIEMINLEGGEGDYDLSVFTSITGKAIRKEVAEYFVKKGEINGAEFYAINNPGKVVLWGVEDKDLYLANLKVYRDSLSYKKEVDDYLKQLTHILNNLKRHIFTSDLLKIDMAYNAYKRLNMELQEYLEFLFERAKMEALQVKKFANLYLLSQSMEMEKNVDFKKANAERYALVKGLKKRLSRNEVKKLMSHAIEFKTKRMSRKAFYGYLLDKAGELGIDIKRFPALRSYILYVTTYEAVDKSIVMRELSGLEAAIKEPLFKNGTQRPLDKLSKNLALMKNIFDITLTKTDYRYYLDNEDSFEASNFIKFFDREAPRYRIAARPARGISRIDHYRRRISRFYEYSFKRDAVFLRKMRFTRVSGDTETAIFMTGGFHTESLCEMFEKEGISYISILPKFTSEKDFKSPYYELLAGQTTNLQRMLASVIAKAAMLQLASQLNPILADEVYSEQERLAFKMAVVMIRDLITSEGASWVYENSDDLVITLVITTEGEKEGEKNVVCSVGNEVLFEKPIVDLEREAEYVAPVAAPKAVPAKVEAPEAAPTATVEEKQMLAAHKAARASRPYIIDKDIGDMQPERVIDWIVTPTGEGMEYPTMKADKNKVDRELRLMSEKENSETRFGGYVYSADPEILKNNLENELKVVVDEMLLEMLDESVKGVDKKPRAIVFVPDGIGDMPEEILNELAGKKYIEKELEEEKYSKIKRKAEDKKRYDLASLRGIYGRFTFVRETNIPESGLVNEVHHVDLGKELLNCERIRKGDFGKGAVIDPALADNIVNHLKMIVTDPESIPKDEKPVRIIEMILDGKLSLPLAAPIDWENWKEEHKALLQIKRAL